MFTRKKISTIHLFLAILLAMALPRHAFPQNAPVTTCATVTNATPGAISVPVTVTGFNNIAAVSLALDYNYWVLHFEGWTPNPQLGSFLVGDFNLGNEMHRLYMGWYGQATSLADGSTLVTLHFTYIDGNSALTWYDDGPSCEYADGQFNVLNDIPTENYYINGYVCGAVGTPGSIDGPASVCPGEQGAIYSIEPVANASSYTWTVPEGAAITAGQGTNLIVADYAETAVSGNVEVFASNNCGDGQSSVLAVTVNALPDVFAGADQNIFYGTSTTIIDAAASGAGPMTYSWDPASLLIDPAILNPTTVILDATAIFTLTVTDANGCVNTDEMTINITGGPLFIDPVAIPSSICRGGFSQLYANAGGGSENYTFLWTCDPPGSPPWSSAEANPQVSPDISTQYFLEVSDGFTMVTGSTGLTVFQLPTATISGMDTLCGTGLYATFTVDLTGSPPWSFVYSNGVTSYYVSGQYTTPYLILAEDPGTYTVLEVEDLHCYGTTYGSATLWVFPLPPQPEIYINGLELQSSSCCGNQWYFNEEEIPGATSQFYTVTESGLYTVVVTLNGCSSEPSEPVDIIVGIDEADAGGMLIFPNPASDRVVIRTSSPFTGPLQVSFYTIDGRLVKSEELNNVNILKDNVFELKPIQPGLYIMKVISGNIVVSKKLVVR